jgi:hypothetical protein
MVLHAYYPNTQEAKVGRPGVHSLCSLCYIVRLCLKKREKSYQRSKEERKERKKGGREGERKDLKIKIITS